MKKLMSFAIILTILFSMSSVSASAESGEFVWLLKPTDTISRPAYSEYYKGVGFVFYENDGDDNSYNDKVGVIDEKGNILIPFEYRNIVPLNEKYVIVTQAEYDSVNSRYNCALTDLKGTEIIQYGKYDSLLKLSSKLLIASKDNKWGVIDTSEKVIVPFKYQGMEPLTENLIRIYDNGYGVIDATGKTIIPTGYKSMIYVRENFILGYDANQSNYPNDKKIDLVANTHGKLLLERNDIQRIVYCEKDVILVEFSDGSFVNINSQGDVMDFKGNKICYIGEDYYLKDFGSNSKANILDLNFNPLIEDKYFAVEPITKNIFRARDFNNSSILINRQGAIPASLEGCTGNPISDNIFAIYKNSPVYGFSAEGLADAEGNIIVSPAFKYIIHCGDNKYLVQTISGRWGIAAFGSGEPVNNWVDGIALTIGSKNATIYGESAVCDVAPVIKDGRTMLPARFVAENLGATVDWDGATQTVTITNDKVQIILTIGSTEGVYKDLKQNFSMKIFLDVPAFIENGRTYTPVRAVAQHLGASVYWDNATRTAIII